MLFLGTQPNDYYREGFIATINMIYRGSGWMIDLFGTEGRISIVLYIFKHYLWEIKIYAVRFGGYGQ